MNDVRDPGRLIVGMECHLQLKTKTKCFSGSPTRFGADPNTLVDPVVLGLPGALPVLNMEAVRQAIRTGLALGCDIAEHTKWDRKHYFYPDLPKGYQISQLDRPLCVDGGIEIDCDDGSTKNIRIQRAHLEEDTGKSTHDEGGDKSRVDLNRAGTPLLEIVSHPDLASADEAVAYLEALRKIVAYIGTSDGNMQEGNLRCEPNVNLVFDNGDKTPIVEVKNINSVQNVKQAIEFEAKRQRDAYYDKGQTMANTPRSTRGWDDDKEATVHQRFKESADDYRYFPEPDVPPLFVSREIVERERKVLPELPRAKERRYQDELGLDAYETGVLTTDPALASWFERALTAGGTKRSAKSIFNWVSGELLRYIKEENVLLDDVALAPEMLAELVDLTDAGTINRRTAQNIFREIVTSNESPKNLVASRGLGQVSDERAIREAAGKAIASNEKAWADYCSGQDKAKGRLIGATMKNLGGRADPAVVVSVLSAMRDESPSS